MKYRGPNDHPQTLGEYVRLDWSMRWSCSACDPTVQYMDMTAARDRHGADYPTDKFMLELHCSKCGHKIGLLTESPAERAESVRVFGISASQGWRAGSTAPKEPGAAP